MNNITSDDLQFDDIETANKFIIENEIKLFSDDGDIIICYQSSAANIASNWNDITTKTALDFQSNLIDQITSKNLLLVFCAHDEIDIDTKKKIQLDTYCCRKITRSNVVDLEKSIKELVFYRVKNDQEITSTPLKKIIEQKHPEVFQLMAMYNDDK